MTKRNRTKRAKLNSHGFKTYKNFKLYIGSPTLNKPAPRNSLIEIVKELWNNDPTIKAMKKHILELSIVYQTTNKIDGNWDIEKQKITIIDNGRHSINDFKSIIVHEIIGHTFFDFARKYRREELIIFNKLANELKPINSYVKDNELKWRSWNDDNEERKRFEKKYHDEIDSDEIDSDEYEKDLKAIEELYKFNGHDSMTRYANEQHSAITEIIYNYSDVMKHSLLNESELKPLIELWNKLHY